MIRDAIKRNRPVGRAAWVEQTAGAGGPGAVPATPRPPGRMAPTRGAEWERHLTVRGTFISFLKRIFALAALMAPGMCLAVAWCVTFSNTFFLTYFHLPAGKPDFSSLSFDLVAGQVQVCYEVTIGEEARQERHDLPIREGLHFARYYYGGGGSAFWNSWDNTDGTGAGVVAAGCGFKSQAAGAMIHATTLYVHLWVVSVIYLLIVGWAAFRSHKRRGPPKAGFCLRCGYDLRASKERCPECGTPIPLDKTRDRPPGEDLKPPETDPPAQPGSPS